MKKIFFSVAIIATAAIAGWNYQQNQTNTELSDLALANIEALARGELGSGPCSNCLINVPTICWYTEVDGCIGLRLTEV